MLVAELGRLNTSEWSGLASNDPVEFCIHPTSTFVQGTPQAARPLIGTHF